MEAYEKKDMCLKLLLEWRISFYGPTIQFVLCGTLTAVEDIDCEDFGGKRCEQNKKIEYSPHVLRHRLSPASFQVDERTVGRGVVGWENV